MLRVLNAVNPLLRYRTVSVAQQCGLRQSVEERLGLPGKPKKPPSAFIKFMAKARSEILAKNPGVRQQDILKIGSEMWKISNESTKKALIEEFKKEYEVYAIQLAKYHESLTPRQKEEIKEAVEELKEQKDKRETKLVNVKRSKELGKPIKPLSSYFLFAKSENQNKGSMTVTEFQTVVSKKWQALPDHVKQKYNAEAAKTKEMYDKELLVWERKMIKQGNLDVVRQKTLDEEFGKKSKAQD